MKILNLYAGIGGNRKLWGNKHNIVAIESNKELAEIYKELYPKDKVIITDAHEFLRRNFKEYDFIWSSPPCQTHSSFRQNICVKFRGTEPKYPDMKLYEEIIFLKANAKGDWLVENVCPYYEPLIKGKKIQRHMIWSNKEIKDFEIRKSNIRKEQIPQLQKRIGINLDKWKVKNKRQILRNCVEPEIGKEILKQIENGKKI